MSYQLQRGQNISLTRLAASVSQVAVGLGWSASKNGKPFNLDASAFMVGQSGKVPSDAYFIFFNQLHSPDGAVEHQGNNTTGEGAGDDEVITVTLPQVEAHINKIVFTVTIYDVGQNFGMVKDAYIRIVDLATREEIVRYNLTERFETETAMVFGELYRYQGDWKFRAVGQGFAGGLSAMASTYGVSVDETEEEPPSAPSQPPPVERDINPSVNPSKRVALEKKMAQKAPQLLDLSKKAAVTLQKVNLNDHQAKVALCLDISYSMYKLYSNGQIQALAERILALGCRFDDDGAIDIFLFGQEAHQAHEMGIDNFSRFIPTMLNMYPLEQATYYGKVMQQIRAYYFPDTKGLDRSTVYQAKQPVYVMFVTDGATQDKGLTKKQLHWSSYEPIFWQFMALGESSLKPKTAKPGFFNKLFGGGNAPASQFQFLHDLDDLTGRYLDNADFFSLETPDEVTDEQLYELLLTEYPTWVTLAHQKGLLE